MTKKDTNELIRRILEEMPCGIANGGYYTLKRSQLVMWLLGKYPTKKQVIHHKNENKLDDRPENLQVMTRSEHSTHHKTDREAAQRAKGRKPHTREWKEANSERMKGNKHVLGYRYTDEQRAKSSESKKARYTDPAARAKTSEAVKEVWRKRREGILPMPGCSTVH